MSKSGSGKFTLAESSRLERKGSTDRNDIATSWPGKASKKPPVLSPQTKKVT